MENNRSGGRTIKITALSPDGPTYRCKYLRIIKKGPNGGASRCLAKGEPFPSGAMKMKGCRLCMEIKGSAISPNFTSCSRAEVIKIESHS